MGGLDDEIRRIHGAQAAAAADAAAWDRSGVSKGDPAVVAPPPQAADLIADFLRRAPRDEWRDYFIGTGPDGVTRINEGGTSPSVWERPPSTKRGWLRTKKIPGALKPGVRRLAATTWDERDPGSKLWRTYLWVFADGRIAGGVHQDRQWWSTRLAQRIVEWQKRPGH